MIENENINEYCCKSCAKFSNGGSRPTTTSSDGFNDQPNTGFRPNTGFGPNSNGPRGPWMDAIEDLEAELSQMIAVI